ncbi:MAG: deoxyribose-phosphate aldolase [Planctomycetaceae bacterium]|jgi:deoxyribose-phosphate aldolase|nr:deoxyribose-phosphate aldolase [Planctomycetaceae bacterium]
MTITPAISPAQLAAMIDVSAVRADSDWNDVQNTAQLARQYRCVAAFSLPGFTRELVELLNGATETIIGGVTGFPDGGTTTSAKVFQARELIELGCSEIDMVMNIGKFLSGRFEQVENDIRSVKQAIGSVPLKVILECHYLTDDQIQTASELAVRAEADWIKTGTGWTSGGTTVKQVQLMKQTVGNAARVKAAGGIGSLKILLELYQAGAERFGIGYKKAQEIFKTVH